MPDPSNINRILEADMARYRAMEMGDVAALEEILGEQFVYIHSTGFSEGRVDYLDRIRSGTVSYGRVERQVDTLRLVDNMVIMTGRIRLPLVLEGKPHLLMNVFLSIWYRAGNRWLLEAWSSTPMPQN